MRIKLNISCFVRGIFAITSFIHDKIINRYSIKRNPPGDAVRSGGFITGESARYILVT